MRSVDTAPWAWNDRGFTAVEMMVAVMLMGLLLIVAIPNVASYNANQRLRSSATELEAAFRRARSAAITKNALVRLDVNADTLSYVMIQDYDSDGTTDAVIGPNVLPRHVQLSEIDFGGGTSVTFNSQGVPSSGGSVTLTGNSGQQRQIRVAPGSGAVSVVTPANAAAANG